MGPRTGSSNVLFEESGEYAPAAQAPVGARIGGPRVGLRLWGEGRTAAQSWTMTRPFPSAGPCAALRGMVASWRLPVFAHGSGEIPRLTILRGPATEVVGFRLYRPD
jgi:hypothetical protein